MPKKKKKICDYPDSNQGSLGSKSTEVSTMLWKPMELTDKNINIQYFTFLSKQLINLINTHIKYTLSVPAFETKAVEYYRLYT